MSNIDKQALRIPERKKHNWGQAVMRDCDFCQQWALTVRHSDGGCICASCCDSEYTTALSSALVVALDELESKDKALSAQDNHINQQADRIESLEKKNGELGRALGAAEKRIADYQELISGLVGVSSSILREVERINNAAAAGKGEAS
ncbi:hypothetical protein [Enterobacter sp. J706]|uniref:hypothetical protein n=1 Tax=Enterobacter sp. J706 TaxID=3444321 RepID=UPI003EBB9E01